MTRVLVLLALAAKLQAQSSSVIICDQASTKHCWAMTAPLAATSSPIKTTMWGKSGALLVGLSDTDLSTASGAVVARDSFISVSGVLNASLGSFGVAGGSVAVASSKTGSGSYLPLTLWTSGTERLRVDTGGNICVGITSCSSLLDVNGVTNHRGNITFNADNTYFIGTAFVQPGVIYGRAIQSKKFQYEDILGGGGFWYSASSVSGPGASIWELVDTLGNVPFEIFRGTTNSFHMDGHIEPSLDNAYDLGHSNAFKDLRLKGSLINGANTVIDSSRNAHFNGLIANTFELPATGSAGCLEASNAGVVTITGNPCVSGSFVTLGTAQTITGVKTWGANQAFDTDNIYYIGTAAIQPGVIYGRAIQSQKFQYEDVLGGGGFWYSASTVSGPGISIWELVDTVGAVPFKINRGTTNSFIMDGHIDPGVSNTYDLGRTHSFKDLRLEGSLINGVNTIIDGSRNGHFNGMVVSTLNLPATGSIGCLQASNIGDVTILGVPCGAGTSQWLSSGSDIYFNTGNVGIGTSSPTSLLHLYNASSVADNTLETGSSFALFRLKSNSRSYQVATAGSGPGSPYSGSLYVFDETAGVIRTLINSSGKMGINNLTPSSQLDVSGDINSTSGYKIGGSTVINSTGAGTFNGLSISTITGSTQCLEVNSSGGVFGTGTSCGSSSLLSSNNTWTGSNGFQGISATSGTFTSSVVVNSGLSGQVGLSGSEWQPFFTDTVALGDTSHTFSSLHVGSGGITASSGISSSTIISAPIFGGSVIVGLFGATQSLTFSSTSTVTAPSGAAGLNGTFTCSGSQNIYQLVVSQGFVTNYACH